MKTKAIRMHGAMDVRLEEFELPEITEEEVLIRVVTDSVCASTYKAIKQGSAHKRVPKDIGENPVIIGHEMCGEILQVGEKLKESWKVGQKIVIQPALKLPNGYDPGYSYPYIGGNTQYAVVPKVVLERGCLLPYEGDSYFAGSLAEALGCCIRGYKGLYHTDYTTYIRTDGAKQGGRIAILGGAGPMGIGCVELAIGYAGVSQVVVTDLNQDRLDYTKEQRVALYQLLKPYEDVACLTCFDMAGVEEALEYLPNMRFHYDGLVTEEILEALSGIISEDRLTIWLPYQNASTFWVKVPFVDQASAQMRKRYGKLGIWILSEEAELKDAEALGADIIETVGTLKPKRK